MSDVETERDEGEEDATPEIDYGVEQSIALRHPIEIGKGRTVEELTFRPIKAGWLLEMDGQTGAKQVLGYARLMSGQTYQTINKLRGKDIGEVIRLVEGFIEYSLTDGETASES